MLAPQMRGEASGYNAERNPACSDRALLPRPGKQRLKASCLREVNVEASRFMELKRVRERSPLMYDAGLTGLIMVPLAPPMSLLVELGILPSVLMLTACWTDQAPSREKAVGGSRLCYSTELRPGRGCCGCMCGLLLLPLAGGTVKHLSLLVNPQRSEKQVQSFTDCTCNRCHKKKKKRVPGRPSNQKHLAQQFCPTNN